MSRRQQLQTAEGVALQYPGYGILQYISKSAPVGGEKGFAPGCEWIVPSGIATLNAGLRYINLGCNGYTTALGTTNPTATWIETDPSNGSATQAGAGTATMLASGNIYRRILTVANGISPSASGVDKIVDKFLLPASSFDVSGRGLQVTVWATAAATGNNKNLKVYAGATNAAGVAIDGTVTETGGVVIGTTGTLTTNNGGLMLQCQLFKTGAAGSNTEESMTTAIIGGGTHAGIGTWTDVTSLTESAAILVVVTVQTTTATTDVVYQGCEYTWFN